MKKEENKLGQTQVSLDQTESVVCEECKSKVFVQSFMINKVPAFLTGTGKVGYMTIPVFVCAKCGHVNEEFLPVELQKKDKSNE